MNDDDFISRRILKLIQADVSYYAMHTNFDAAPGCMGDLAADRLKLSEREILEPMGLMEDGRPCGIGTVGFLPEEMTVREAAEYVKKAFELPFVTVYGADGGRSLVKKAAVCPGAGGSPLQMLWRRVLRSTLPEISVIIQELMQRHREWL